MLSWLPSSISAACPAQGQHHHESRSVGSRRGSGGRVPAPGGVGMVSQGWYRDAMGYHHGGPGPASRPCCAAGRLGYSVLWTCGVHLQNPRWETTPRTPRALPKAASTDPEASSPFPAILHAAQPGEVPAAGWPRHRSRSLGRWKKPTTGSGTGTPGRKPVPSTCCPCTSTAGWSTLPPAPSGSTPRYGLGCSPVGPACGEPPIPVQGFVPSPGGLSLAGCTPGTGPGGEGCAGEAASLGWERSKLGRRWA